MFSYLMFQTREADLIRAAKQRRLVREAREARKANRAAGAAPQRSPRHETERQASDPAPAWRALPPAA